MIQRLALILLMTSSALSFAQEDLNRALQTEYLYLVSQKEALLRQRESLAKNFSGRLEANKKEISALQKSVVALTTANDQAFEELSQLEKQRRDLEKRGSNLESTYKKATAVLHQTERALQFDSAKEPIAAALPGNLKLHDLGPLFSQADQLLRRSAAQETFMGSFIDQTGKLAAGPVKRIGRVAAILEDAKNPIVLGPGNGVLSALKTETKDQIYFFENLNQEARLQQPATWLETCADFAPLLFLGLMLALVAGLFSALIKV